VSGDRDADNKLVTLKDAYFAWPEQATNAAKWVQSETNAGRDVYHCAHLLTARRRIKANAAPVRCLWGEWDGPVPDHIPTPTATVQSSEGRYHLYWQLDRSISPEHAQGLTRRIANGFAADCSGWDLSQLLRPAATRNHKYDDAPAVELVSIDDALTYDPDVLDDLLPALPATPVAVRTTATLTLDDYTLIEKLRGASNGAKFDRLYAGDDGEHGGDTSAADLAFVSMVGFYSTDEAQLDRVFRQSGRYRAKWERADYRQSTIAKALQRSEFYAPRRTTPTVLLTAQQLIDASLVAGDEETDDDAPHQCLPQLARIAELEQQLAARDEQIARLQTRIRMHNGEKRVRQNRQLKAERDTVIEIAHAVTTLQERERRRARLEGREPNDEVKIPPYRVLAERMGCSPSKVSRDISKLKQWGLLNVRQESPLKPARITNDGVILDAQFVTETFVTLSASPESWLASMESFEPERESTHGGTRTRCPHHPNADTVVTETCAECDLVLHRRVKRSQNAEFGLQTGDCNLHAETTTPPSVVQGNRTAFCNPPAVQDAIPNVSAMTHARERFHESRARHHSAIAPAPIRIETVPASNQCDLCRRSTLQNAAERKAGRHAYDCLAPIDVTKPLSLVKPSPSQPTWGGND